MNYPIDEHGQPMFLSAKDKIRLTERTIDEMLGICKGIIADGKITQEESDFICEWLLQHKETSNMWPISELSRRVNKMLDDKNIDEEEKAELLETLRQITGGDTCSSTTLPLTVPPPEVVFKDKNYCFTGHFVAGTRKQVETIVLNKGGFTQANPTLKTDYLVIGILGSTTWIHSPYGRKIEKAVEIRETKGINIISEKHWAQFI